MKRGSIGGIMSRAGHPRTPALILVLAAAAAGCKQGDENVAPEAAATGPDGTVAAGTWVQLDSAGSSDPEGATLHRQWAFQRLPVGSAAELNDPTVQNPSFLADVPGEYVVSLVVDDGFLRSAPSDVTITVDPTNQPPVAASGLDRNVVTGADVLLDGQDSYDPEESPLSYAWSFVQKPSGSNAAFDDAASATPTFRADLDGAYVVRLIVNDGELDSAPVEVTVFASLDNLAPIANAGVDQAVVAGATVSLDGSGSYDPNGGTLTYTWTFTERPTGSAAAITQDGTAAASFDVDTEGTYRVALVVDDGAVTSSPDELVITATVEDLPPEVHAGDDQSVTTGAPVTLDGTATTDADGDALTFAWSFWSVPTGSDAALNTTSVVKPSFVPDVDGEYILRLDAFDGVFWGAPDFVTITASGGNRVPIADAGDPITAAVADVVALDGSGSSDPDSGDLITYAWRFVDKPAGSLAALNDGSLVAPSFVPDRDGDYVLELVVTDGELWSAPAAVTATIAVGNLPPTSAAGADQNVTTGATVQLDGSASADSDGDPLGYAWDFLSVPAGFMGGLNDPNVVNPSFVPNADGTYVVQLMTFDGTVWGAADTVTITASGGNVAPVADAGDDAGVDTGTVTALDGSGTTDANSDPLTYAWSFVSKPAGSNAALNDATVRSPSFVPDVDGDYVLRLRAFDGRLWSAADSVTITAGNGNTSPTADAGVDRTITTGAVVALDGSASDDPESDPLAYQWSFAALPAGSRALLNDTSVVSPSFVSDVNGDYVARLVVFDGQFWSAPDTVTITGSGGNSAPVANAGADANVTVSATVQADGSGSSDADSNPLTYEWQFVTLPSGSQARFNNASLRNPSFVADRAGTYTLRLRVFDGWVWSTADFVVFTAS